MIIIKSYVVKEVGVDLLLWEYDVGELQLEDVEVEVEYCGICYLDLLMIDNEWGMLSYLLVVGYEVIGWVVVLGSVVQDKGLKIGQKVGIGWMVCSCGYCDVCISGNQINCLEGLVLIIFNCGGFVNKLCVDWQWVIFLLESIDLVFVGLMLCGGIIVFKLLLIYYVIVISCVGVIGIGGFGYIVIKLLWVMGVEVIVFSFNLVKEQEVLVMGIDCVVNSCDLEVLKVLVGQFDLIINIVVVDFDWQLYFEVLVYGGNFYIVGVVMKLFLVLVFILIGGDCSIFGLVIGNLFELCMLMKFVGCSKVVLIIELFLML